MFSRGTQCEPIQLCERLYSIVETPFYTQYLLWVEAVLSSPVVSLRITGLGHGTEDVVSSNWLGKQTSSQDGTGSPDLRIFSQSGLPLRHASVSKIFSSIFNNHKKQQRLKTFNHYIISNSVGSSQVLGHRWTANK